jgi:hypothetical protein
VRWALELIGAVILITAALAALLVLIFGRTTQDPWEGDPEKEQRFAKVVARALR